MSHRHRKTPTFKDKILKGSEGSPPNTGIMAADKVEDWIEGPAVNVYVPNCSNFYKCTGGHSLKVNVFGE